MILKKFLEENDITAKKFAQRAKVDVRIIEQLLAGNGDIYLNDFVSVVKALGVSADDFAKDYFNPRACRFCAEN